jgi:hypothetical protein
MEVQLDPRAAHIIRPHDQVSNKDISGVNLIIDSLEKQVCHYINTQAQAASPLQLNFIRDLFFQTKRRIRNG